MKKQGDGLARPPAIFGHDERAALTVARSFAVEGKKHDAARCAPVFLWPVRSVLSMGKAPVVLRVEDSHWVVVLFRDDDAVRVRITYAGDPHALRCVATLGSLGELGRNTPSPNEPSSVDGRARRYGALHNRRCEAKELGAAEQLGARDEAGVVALSHWYTAPRAVNPYTVLAEHRIELRVCVSAACGCVMRGEVVGVCSGWEYNELMR